MNDAVWGDLFSTLLGAGIAVAAIVLLARRRWLQAGYCGIAIGILIFPIKQWFWQFELTGRGLPHWYVYSAVFQIAIGIGGLVWACFGRFRPISTAVAVTYVFSLILQLFSYMYWAYGTTRDFNANLSHLDSFYFALGTLSTAGTGNISAISETTRGLQTLQMGLDFILIGFVVVLILTRYSNLLDHQPTSAHDRARLATPERILEMTKSPAELGDAASQPNVAVTESGDASAKPTPEPGDATSQPSAPDTPPANRGGEPEP